MAHGYSDWRKRQGKISSGNGVPTLTSRKRKHARSMADGSTLRAPRVESPLNFTVTAMTGYAGYRPQTELRLGRVGIECELKRDPSSGCERNRW